MSARLAAVVLAAGASTRMGRPKALLQWRGRPFVFHAVMLGRAADAEPVVVVSGAVPLPNAALGPATVVHNERWSDGPLGSLQTGLAAVRAKAPDASAIVLTVDRPHIEPDTVRALADAARDEPTMIWQPQVGAERGHPIIYPPDVVAQLLAVPHGQTPRDVLARPDVAARRRVLAVDDRTVLDNLDRPEHLKRLPP